jgi:hypothetical protein
MGMDRLLERLREGAPPLRVHEVSAMTGYSPPVVRKLIDAGVIQAVGLTAERRVPVTEARRLLSDLGILQD